MDLRKGSKASLKKNRLKKFLKNFEKQIPLSNLNFVTKRKLSMLLSYMFSTLLVIIFLCFSAYCFLRFLEYLFQANLNLKMLNFASLHLNFSLEFARFHLGHFKNDIIGGRPHLVRT